MKGMSILRSEGLIPVTIAVVVSVFFVVATVQATTTISTNIVTEGTLEVTGISTLTGAVTAQSTLTVTGATTLANASTTQFSNIQTANNATTTAYLGCVQTYATTTEQPIKLVFYSSSTVASAVTSASMTAGAGGYVLFAYGYCP